MPTSKAQWRYKTVNELRIERFLIVSFTACITYAVTQLCSEPGVQEQQESIYRIQHMIKACVPNSTDQVTTMRLVPLPQRNGHYELRCDKQPVKLDNSVKPSTVIRRAI